LVPSRLYRTPHNFSVLLPELCNRRYNVWTKTRTSGVTVKLEAELFRGGFSARLSLSPGNVVTDDHPIRMKGVEIGGILKEHGQTHRGDYGNIFGVF
jgi:hypothetical protein